MQQLRRGEPDLSELRDFRRHRALIVERRRTGDVVARYQAARSRPASRLLNPKRSEVARDRGATEYYAIGSIRRIPRDR